MTKRAKVVAVCGIPGAGKTSLVEALTAAVPASRHLHVDEYLPPSVLYADLTQWTAAGADFSQWAAPGLHEALSALLQDSSVSCVFLEEARGRHSPETGTLIDHLVYLAIPRDISLVRKILQIADSHSLDDVTGYCRHYLRCSAGVIDAIESKVRPQADLVLDASAPVDSLVEAVIREFELPSAVTGRGAV